MRIIARVNELVNYDVDELLERLMRRCNATFSYHWSVRADWS